MHASTLHVYGPDLRGEVTAEQPYGRQGDLTHLSKVYTELYVLRGWNVTTDNNGRLSYGLTVGWTTLTGDIRLGSRTGFLRFLLRPELRYDRSTAPFFSEGGRFRARRDQATAELGLVGYF